mgnify:CR=1
MMYDLSFPGREKGVMTDWKKIFCLLSFKLAGSIENMIESSKKGLHDHTLETSMINFSKIKNLI